MGRRERVPALSAISPEQMERRRRSLARKITLMTPELVRASISEKKAASLGLGAEWRRKVGP